MLQQDFIAFTYSAIRARRSRAFLTALGIGIGVAAVVLLTSIGAGVQQYVLHQFTQFGTNIISVQPGKSQTFGANPGQFASMRPLTIDDAMAFKRIPKVLNVVPMMQGNSDVEANGRVRRTTVFGVGPEFDEAYTFSLAGGSFLPEDDPTAPRAVAVLGSKMRHEIFGDANPLGALIRIGGERFRIIGFMQSKGSMIGFDLDDTVYIPTARALSLFNRNGLLQVDVVYAPGVSAREVSDAVTRVLMARHGREDFTVVTQQEMLDTLGNILGVLTAAVGALGGISLLVGGVGIFTIMTIAVRERTGEIGLLRALGATQRSILKFFLGEAVLLSAIGGLGGLAVGIGIALLLSALVPALPVHIELGYSLLAEVIAVLIGLISGVLPAVRAAGLQPVDALRTE
jgi:putative ABC transport system permease protein